MTAEFFFALEFPGQGVSAALLTDLASQVLRHLGSSVEGLPELVEALRQSVAQEAASAECLCGVRFRARAGRLEILVSSNGGRIWQTSRTIA